MDKTLSRRTALAGGVSVIGALAGCLGQDGTDDNPGGDDPDPSDPDSAQAPFREWLAAPGSIGEPGGDNPTYRFNYTPFLIEQTLETGRASVLDIDPTDVDGSLTQTPALILLGSFDRSRLETSLENADGYALTGEYGSYRTAKHTDRDTRFALGEAAVLIGQSLELWIDTRTGDDERLEETTPVFTRLFDRLPSLDASIVGELGPPGSFTADLDGIDAWVNASPQLVSGETITQRWVYAFDEQPSEDIAQTIQQELSSSPLVGAITETAVDGEFLTVTGKSRLPESSGD